MFPNVRLIIVAIAASVVALSIGFGMFAAFRVNHEPLSRLQSGVAPPQLIAEAAPSIVTPAVVEETLGSGYQSNAPRIEHTAVESVAIQIVRPDKSEMPSAAPAAEPQSDTLAVLAPQPVPRPEQMAVLAASTTAPAPQSPAPRADNPAQQSGAAAAPAPQPLAPKADNSSEQSDAAAAAAPAKKNESAGGTVETTGAISGTKAPDSAPIDQPADQLQIVIQDRIKQSVEPNQTVTPRRKIVRRTVRRRFAATSPGAKATGASVQYRYNNPFASPQQNFGYSAETAPQPNSAQAVARPIPRRALFRRARLIKRPVVQKTADQNTAISKAADQKADVQKAQLVKTPGP